MARVEVERDKLGYQKETFGLDTVGNGEPLKVPEKGSEDEGSVARSPFAMAVEAVSCGARGGGCDLLAPPLFHRAGQW